MARYELRLRSSVAKDLRGYGTRFSLDATGPAQRFEMIQPNGVFEAKRVTSSPR